MYEKAIAAAIEVGAAVFDKGLVAEAASGFGSRILTSPAQKQATAEAVAELAQILVKDRPQVNAEGRLQWYFAGSVGSNLLAGAERITELDGARLPGVFPARTLELAESAKQSLNAFVRPVGDVDLVTIPGYKRTYRSGYSGPSYSDLTGKARAAFKSSSDGGNILFDSFHFTMQPPVAVRIDGQPIYVAHPAASAVTKMVGAMSEFPMIEAEKLSGDFAHLHAAARTIMSDTDLADLGVRTLQQYSSSGYRMYLHDYDPAWTGPIKTFTDDVINSHPESIHLRGLGDSRTYALSLIRAISRLPEDGQLALGQFIKDNKNMLESWSVEFGTIHNRRLIAKEILKDHPDKVDSFIKFAEHSKEFSKQSTRSVSLEDKIYVALKDRQLAEKLGVRPNQQNLRKTPRHSCWMDALRLIDPLQAKSDLTNLEHLGRRGMSVWDLSETLSSLRDHDPAVRTQIWSSLRQLADKGLTPEELNSETSKFVQWLETK